jgi:hypothetical protein
VLDKLLNKEAYSSPPNSDTLLTGKMLSRRKKRALPAKRVDLDQRGASHP